MAWRLYWRDICIESIKKPDYQIGGVGKVVQIDESQFSKRKCNRRRLYSAQWVFEEIDSETDKCFFEMVPDRTKETLQEVIMRKIKPGPQ